MSSVSADIHSETLVLLPLIWVHTSFRDIYTQVNACSTFNVLNAEDRRVAAALLQLSETEEEV